MTLQELATRCEANYQSGGQQTTIVSTGEHTYFAARWCKSDGTGVEWELLVRPPRRKAIYKSV